MGVPAFYGWLLRAFKGAQVPSTGMQSENVYVDMNSVIHPACHSDGVSHKGRTEEEMMEVVCEHLERIVDIAKPQRLLFLAVDGVAPAAKISQQRGRRTRSVRDAIESVALEDKVRAKKLEAGEPLPCAPVFHLDSWDSNVITPGTEFMHRLAARIDSYVADRIQSGAWRGFKVILSDATVPGEGEHKVLEFMRFQRDAAAKETDKEEVTKAEVVARATEAGMGHEIGGQSQPGKGEASVTRDAKAAPAAPAAAAAAESKKPPRIKHCIVGEDADLIMLGLSTHMEGVGILRNLESLNAMMDRNRLKRQRKPMPYDGARPEMDLGSQFRVTKIDVIRAGLNGKLDAAGDTKMSKAQRVNAINDILLVFMLGGNDFLPHVPSMDIRDGACEKLLDTYLRTAAKRRRFIVNSKDHSLNLRHLREFLASAALLHEKKMVFATKAEMAELRKCAGQSAEDLVYPKKDQWRWRPTPSMRPCKQYSRFGTCPRHQRCEYLHDAVVPVENSLRRVLSHVLAFALTESEKAVEGQLEPLPPFGDGSFFIKGSRKSPGQHGDVVVTASGQAELHLSNLDDVEDKHATALATMLGLGTVTIGTSPERATLVLSHPRLSDPEERVKRAVMNREILERFYKDEVSEVSGWEENAITANARESELMLRTSDKLKPWLYYLEKFNWDTRVEAFDLNVDWLVEQYVRGLQWTAHYYFGGIKSWSWSFPAHYAPFLLDLALRLDKVELPRINSWPQDGPISPIHQLMSVLPVKSSHAVPGACVPLMADPESPIAEAYPDPTAIELDPNGRRYRWQWVPLMPDINHDEVGAAVDATRDTWTVEEKQRDVVGVPKLFATDSDLQEPFARRPNPAAHHALSLPRHGIVGVISNPRIPPSLSANDRIKSGTLDNAPVAYDFTLRRGLFTSARHRGPAAPLAMRVMRRALRR